MNFLQAVKRAAKTGETFYHYYEDGSCDEYRLSNNGTLFDHYDEFPSFDIERLLSKKFTFDKRVTTKKPK